MLSEDELWAFAVLIRQMRDAQKEYFGDRNYDRLARAKRLEREVDISVTRVLTRLHRGADDGLVET
jgi:hypothetical protein